MIGLQRGNRLERHGVVAHHLHLGAQLAQVLHEVVGERIVVIDDEDHSRHKPCCASSRARSSAARLVAGFLVLGGRVRVHHDAGAGLHVGLAADMITVRIAMQKSRLPAKST